MRETIKAISTYRELIVKLMIVGMVIGANAFFVYSFVSALQMPITR